MAKKTGKRVPGALTSSKKKNQALRRSRHKKMASSGGER
ncbi:hypothetical protein ES707_00151 [subsurface metagenome]